LFVFAREERVFGAKAVGQAVETHCGFAFFGARAGAVLRVAAVGRDLC
jgi:hypothetical protein